MNKIYKKYCTKIEAIISTGETINRFQILQMISYIINLDYQINLTFSTIIAHYNTPTKPA